MNDKKKLIVLTGPTAVGKTELSIRLAKELNGQIISADSVQVYREMNIGSAKITTKEMQGVKHHLIDILNPDEKFDVATFKTLSNEAIKKIYADGCIPIIVGGTGFYIQACLKDVCFTDNNESEYRKELEALYNEKGGSYLFEMLRDIDPKSCEVIHENNVKRVIRAIEFFKQTGTKISEHNDTEKEKESPYNYAYFVLTMNREKLYKRIEKRIDIMINDGLLEEVAYLLDKYHLSKDMTSMQGLGYKEIVAYLQGEMSLDEAIYVLKRDTRHFAKRQLTWFKREKDVTWIDKDILISEDSQMEYILNELKAREII